MLLIKYISRLAFLCLSLDKMCFLDAIFPPSALGLRFKVMSWLGRMGKVFFVELVAFAPLSVKLTVWSTIHGNIRSTPAT